MRRAFHEAFLKASNSARALLASRSMRTTVIVAAALLFLLGPTRAAHADDAPAFGHDESPYQLRLDIDIAAVVLGGVLWAGPNFIGNTTAPPSCGGSTTPACVVGDLNPFDRLAVGYSSQAARTAADVISLLPIAYLAIDIIDVRFRHWRTYLTDLWVMAEVLVWNGAIQELTRRAVRRPRPFLYTPGVYPSERDHSESGFSFYSGHTSFAFAVATV